MCEEIILNVRYKQLMPKFLELRRSELPIIENAIAQEDFTTLSRLGHNLKGAGASYGLESLSTIGKQLENAAQIGDVEALKEVHQSLTAFLSSVKVGFRNSILFVDDQTEIIALLRRLFTREEYLCYFANSASEALEFLNREPIDVMVCDLVMPEMGGLELLSIVRQRYPNIVRLVLSGQAQVPSILAAINAGQVFRYLTKPWRIDAEARAIIADAVAYANESNDMQPHNLQIAVDKICALLETTGSRYLLLGRGERIVCSSANMQDKWPQGRDISGHIDNLPEGGRKITLDRWHTAWIWPN